MFTNGQTHFKNLATFAFEKLNFWNSKMSLHFKNQKLDNHKCKDYQRELNLNQTLMILKFQSQKESLAKDIRINLNHRLYRIIKKSKPFHIIKFENSKIVTETLALILLYKHLNGWFMNTKKKTEVKSGSPYRDFWRSQFQFCEIEKLTKTKANVARFSAKMELSRW